MMWVIADWYLKLVAEGLVARAIARARRMAPRVLALLYFWSGRL